MDEAVEEVRDLEVTGKQRGAHAPRALSVASGLSWNDRLAERVSRPLVSEEW
jgi:hypothetical protein